MLLNKKLHLFSSYKFLSLLIFNSLFFIAAAYFFPIRFETNDDVSMLLIASGKYTGTPDAHLVFINYVYGYFLKLLYTWNRHIEWYPVLFAVFHVISISVIEWFVLLKARSQILFKILFLGVFYSLELRSIMLFQFTTTSAICAVAGLILIAEGKNYQKAFGTILFILASLIRLEAALLIFGIISPVFLKNIFIAGKLVLDKSLLFLVVALVILGALKFIDYRSYQSDKEWSYYEKYNRIRGKINDNPYIYKFPLPKKVTSYEMALLSDFFPDAHTLTYKKLITIRNGVQQVKLKSILLNFFSSLKPFKLIFGVALLSFVLFFLYNNDKKAGLICCLSGCLFLLSFIYISSFGSMKSRVFHSSLMGLFAVILILFQYKIITNKYVNFNEKSFIISLFLFILLFNRQTIIYHTLDMYSRKFEFSQQKELMDKYLQNPANSVVPFLMDFSIELYSPFSEINFKPGQILFSSWLTNIPFNHSKFDSFLDLIDRHAIFLKKDNNEKILTLIQKSIWFNYGIRVIEKKEMESKDYVIIKLQKGN